MNKLTLVLLIVFSYYFAHSQTLDSKYVYQQIAVLSHDSMMGREAGAVEELKSRDYLVQEFKKLGLKPYFDGSYMQWFEFKDGIDYSQGTTLTFGDKNLKAGSDFYPISRSANGTYKGAAIYVGFGIKTADGSTNDYAKLTDLSGKAFIIELSAPKGFDKAGKYAAEASMDGKIDMAISLGAKAVIFVNNDPDFTDPRARMSNRADRSDIPVVVVMSNDFHNLQPAQQMELSLEINLQKITKKAYNVAGYMDRGAAKTLILGAHYDHLGMGGETSRYKGEPKVHNGADDNASGVAGVMEMARYFSSINNLNYNILFLAFSGEEKGLLGSNAFVKSNYFSKEKTLAMINFDMLGRLDSTKKVLTLIGTGTATEWDTLIAQTPNHGLTIKKSASGVGGSDQMSFYQQEVPVLFFFTGLHNDYHTPDDDIEKINLQGEMDVLAFATDLMGKLQKYEKLTFAKTKDEDQGKSRSYKNGVTLGIVPDFSSEVPGVGVGSVIQDKPAQKAGLQSGDVIIKLGDVEIKDMPDYMKALRNIKVGDKTKVVVLRNGKPKKFKLQF